MKLNKLFLGAIAALASAAMVACSDDAPKGPDTPVEGGEQYMAVTIKNVGENSRALPEDDEFEEPVGTEAEITTDNIRFYFFTESGNPFIMSLKGVNGEVSNVNMVKPAEIKQNNTPGQEGTINGVLVLGTSSTGYEGNIPYSVIAIVNPRGHNFEYYANKSLNEIRQEQITMPETFGDFVMTSSSYVSGGKVIDYTVVKDKVKNTPDEAKQKPANIYLERLAAKIRVKGLTTYTAQTKAEDGTLSDTEYSIIGANGATQKIKVTLTGCKVINRAKKTYGIKNITPFLTNEPFTDWNDENRHRSYWAYTSAADDTDFMDQTYDISNPDDFSLNNFDSNNPTNNIVYTYGNTRFDEFVKAGIGATDRTTNATAIVVRGIVQIDGVTYEEGKGENLIFWGGDYYLLNNFKEMVAEAWNKDAGEVGNDYTADDVTLIKDNANPNAVVPAINNNAYTRFGNAQWWKDGQTSYYTNIKHLAGMYGVVRNHIYEYNFTNVVGLGVPGNDQENPKEPTETYLASTIYCLNWLVVSNNTVLE